MLSKYKTAWVCWANIVLIRFFIEILRYTGMYILKLKKNPMFDAFLIHSSASSVNKSTAQEFSGALFAIRKFGFSICLLPIPSPSCFIRMFAKNINWKSGKMELIRQRLIFERYFRVAKKGDLIIKIKLLATYLVSVRASRFKWFWTRVSFFNSPWLIYKAQSPHGIGRWHPMPAEEERWRKPPWDQRWINARWRSTSWTVSFYHSI